MAARVTLLTYTYTFYKIKIIYDQTALHALMSDEPPIAELTAFVHVLLSDCTVTRCDEGLYICQARTREGYTTALGGETSFALGQGELAAHIRATTDVDDSESGGDARSDSGDSSNSSNSTSGSDGGSSRSENESSDDSEFEGQAQVVVNVGRPRKRRKR